MWILVKGPGCALFVLMFVGVVGCLPGSGGGESEDTARVAPDEGSLRIADETGLALSLSGSRIEELELRFEVGGGDEGRLGVVAFVPPGLGAATKPLPPAGHDEVGSLLVAMAVPSEGGVWDIQVGAALPESLKSALVDGGGLEGWEYAGYVTPALVAVPLLDARRTGDQVVFRGEDLPQGVVVLGSEADGADRGPEGVYPSVAVPNSRAGAFFYVEQGATTQRVVWEQQNEGEER